MNNIFNSPLTISFWRLEQDLAARGRNRLLGQFKSEFPRQKDIDSFLQERIAYYIEQGADEEEAKAKAEAETKEAVRYLAAKHFSPVLAQVMNAIGAEFAYCYEQLVGTLRYRTLAEAQGANLDVLGVLVGQNRILFDYSLKNWFCPDGGGGADQGLAWMEGANVYGDEQADDTVYRQMILAKIFKNHVKAASAPEIKVALKMATGNFVSFIRDGILSAVIVVPENIDISLIRGFCKQYKTAYVESSYLLPVPPCVAISGILVVPMAEGGGGIAFTPDQPGKGADQGRAAVKGEL